MKKVSLFGIFALLLLLFSCKSNPEILPDEIPVQTDESASIIMPPDEPALQDIISPLLEPSEDPLEEYFSRVEEAASTATIPDEPTQNDILIDLLEPSEPEQEFPLEESANIEQELPPASNENETSRNDTPTPDRSAENPSSQNAETPKQEQIPEPPAFLRPAEPINDTSIEREAVPIPVNPIPNLPAQPRKESDDVVFSRTVRATVGQIIEIPYRGSGWVFLGELGARRGIAYDSRRMDTEGQNFRFIAEESGNYILKFYKEDYIRDYILNDHVQVIIGEAPEPSGIGWFNPPSDWSVVIAEPRWPPESGNPNVPPDASQTASPQTSQANRGDTLSPPKIETADEGNSSSDFPISPNSPTGNAPNTTNAVIPTNASPEEYMQKARDEFDAGRIDQAISIMEQFRQQYPSGSDEAFWLLGQFYEANSPNRDIRTSLSYYQRLIDEYPQSRRYSEAKARIAYLERYYLNIR
jgi:TolA-binding protein